MKNTTNIKTKVLKRYKCERCGEITNAKFPLGFKIPEKLICNFCAADNFLIKERDRK